MSENSKFGRVFSSIFDGFDERKPRPADTKRCGPCLCSLAAAAEFVSGGIKGAEHAGVEGKEARSHRRE